MLQWQCMATLLGLPFSLWLPCNYLLREAVSGAATVWQLATAVQTQLRIALSTILRCRIPIANKIAHEMWNNLVVSRVMFNFIITFFSSKVICAPQSCSVDKVCRQLQKNAIYTIQHQGQPPFVLKTCVLVLRFIGTVHRVCMIHSIQPLLSENLNKPLLPENLNLLISLLLFSSGVQVLNWENLWCIKKPMEVSQVQGLSKVTLWRKLTKRRPINHTSLIPVNR